MRAMILAAGRGERMRPLTDHTPKPLLCVGGKALIVWHIERLAAAGINEIVINHAWLGEQFPAQLGDGSCYGVSIRYSAESPTALETAGGIARALPLLGESPFLVINGDIWCDWDPSQVHHARDALHHTHADAWLLLVNNPDHNPEGDFYLSPTGHVSTLATDTTSRLTFAGIGLYQPSLFAPLSGETSAPLAPLLRASMARNAVIGAHHTGAWTDVGTPARLAALENHLTSANA